MRYPDGTYDLTVDDIHEIREKNYKLTKSMSSQELIEYYNIILILKYRPCRTPPAGLSLLVGEWKL